VILEIAWLQHSYIFRRQAEEYWLERIAPYMFCDQPFWSRLSRSFEPMCSSDAPKLSGSLIAKSRKPTA
jgi:hypothetical protein